MNGTAYLFKGMQMLSQPGIRGFVIIPLLLNMALFAALTGFLYLQFSELLAWLMNFVPDWLDFLVWILWLLFILLLLVVYGYSFAIFGNLIASPFYGLLAERVQAQVTGNIDDRPLTLELLWQITRRSLLRELQKLFYFLPRLVAVLLLALILTFIPVLDLLVPVLFFVWGSWSLAIEFLDYPADNNLVPFPRSRDRLRAQRLRSLSFGGGTLFLSTLPVINLLALPAAVAGATLMWLDYFGDDPVRLTAGKSPSYKP